MVREKIKVSTQKLRWTCVKSKEDPGLYYGRFMLSPLMKGQADTIGIAMRRSLLGEIEGTCITRATFEKITHEFAPLFGIQESVQEILMNLKKIVLRGNPYGTKQALIYVEGPGDVTAKNLILPPTVKVVDKKQHIATLLEPIDFCLDLEIERGRGYNIKTPKNFNDGSYPIDAVFMPVRNVNYSIHYYGNGNDKQEILFLEIWTNGSLTPQEALQEAARNLIDLFIPFLHEEKIEQWPYGKFQPDKELEFPRFYFFNFVTSALKAKCPPLSIIQQSKRKVAVDLMYIDQFEFPPRIYYCLKKANIHTLWDLLWKSKKELLQIEHLRKEDVKLILDYIHKKAE